MLLELLFLAIPALLAAGGGSGSSSKTSTDDSTKTTYVPKSVLSSKYPSIVDYPSFDVKSTFAKQYNSIPYGSRLRNNYLLDESLSL